MANQNPVNWFEIPVNDLDRAKAFYKTVFDPELSVNEMGQLQFPCTPRPRPGELTAFVPGTEV